MAAMLRGSKVLWWSLAPVAGLGYHLTTLKAADNPRKKIDPKDLEIYDKPEDDAKSRTPEDDQPTSLEEQISKGRKFVWKHSDKVKNVAESSSTSAKSFWQKTKDFSKDIQTDHTLQIKTGAITVATLTGILLAGKGRRPLRRVFYAGTLGTVTAAVCYPDKASDTAKSVYHKLTSLGSDSKPGSKTKPDDGIDQFRSGETLMLEEAIVLSEMVYDELLKRIHVEDIHLPDFKTICNEVVQDILLGINEDFEIQTGGYVGENHAESHAGPQSSYDVKLHVKDLTARVVEEVLDSINEDMEIQTGGAFSGAPTIALDSTVLAKKISAKVSKLLEQDVARVAGADQQYLFANPTQLSRVVCEEYTKCVDHAIRAQVPTGKCHVIISSSSLAAKTAAELQVAIDTLRNSRTVVVGSGSPVKQSDVKKTTEQVASDLLEFIEKRISSSHGNDYVFSEAGDIVKKASQEATKAIASDVKSGAEVKNRKTRVVLDLAKKVGEEVIEAINEDIEIQTGSGLRGPSANKPRAPRKPSTPLKEDDVRALDGIMYSPMYVPGFDHVADAVIEEVSETLHGRGVVVHELEHMAQVTMQDILAGVSEDIEIQTGGWSTREHKPHAVLNAKNLVRQIAQEVLDAIEEDMNIQTGGKLERKRDLYFDSSRLAKNIVDSVMTDVDLDIKKSECSGPYLFSVPEKLGELALKGLQNKIDQTAIGVGRNIGRVHVDVDALSEEVGKQLKERIEARYIKGNPVGEFRDREVAIVDFGEIRKSVGGTMQKSLLENPLITLRPGNEPVHVIEDWGKLTKRVVETTTKAIQEDIEIQTGGAKLGTSLSLLIDARDLVASVFEEVAEAVEEDIDIQTGRGFRTQEETKAREEKPDSGGEPGQSEPEDKDMYSTRSK